MRPLRVVLAGMPQILKQIVRALLRQQPDMRAVGEVETLVELPRAIRSLRAQAVVLTFPRRSAASHGPGYYLARLRQHHPALILLALAPQHDRAVIWRPTSDPRPAELSATGIIGALRGSWQSSTR